MKTVFQLGISIYVQIFGIETLKNSKRNPVAQFMFTLLAEFARLERETLRERILSGMDEARRQGIQIGRPVGATEEKAVFLKKYAAVARQLQAGLSVRKTGQAVRRGHQHRAESESLALILSCAMPCSSNPN